MIYEKYKNKIAVLGGEVRRTDKNLEVIYF